MEGGSGEAHVVVGVGVVRGCGCCCGGGGGGRGGGVIRTAGL